MASMQIDGLLHLLDGGADPATVAAPFGAWCDRWIRPWVDDHLAIDGEAVRSWQGADVDLARPLTSAAIVAAAQADGRIAPFLGGYLGMTALPASLAPAEPLARAVYESGWRPPLSDGPTRDELVDLLRAATTESSTPAVAAALVERVTAGRPLSAPHPDGVGNPLGQQRNPCLIPGSESRARRTWRGHRTPPVAVTTTMNRT